jgi:hypothetical protein
MLAILQQARQSCGQKNVALWRHVVCREGESNLSPQIIVGGSGLECVLGPVFIEHTLKDHHVAGRHIDDLKANIVGVGIHVIRMAPSAAGNEHHRILIGNIGSQLDLHAKILTDRDFLWTIQPEASRTDIGKIPNELLAQIVGDLHVVGKITTRNFPLFCHCASSFASLKYMTSMGKIQ